MSAMLIFDKNVMMLSPDMSQFQNMTDLLEWENQKNFRNKLLCIFLNISVGKDLWRNWCVKNKTRPEY